MSEGPKLQDAQPGDPPGKLVELVLDLIGEDDEPTVLALREGEPHATFAGTWREVGMQLRLEAANTAGVRCEVRRTIDLEYSEVEGDYVDAVLLMDWGDWFLDPKLEDKLYDAPDLWTEAPWLSTQNYKARYERLYAKNNGEECTWQWLELIEKELKRRVQKDERDEIKRLRAEVKELRAENARLLGKQP